jgi:hypothetical protein
MFRKKPDYESVFNILLSQNREKIKRVIEDQSIYLKNPHNGISALEEFAINLLNLSGTDPSGDPVKIMTRSGIFATEESASDFLELTKSKFIALLTYSRSSFGTDEISVVNILKENLRTIPYFIEALNIIEQKKLKTRDLDLEILIINNEDHLAFFILEKHRDKKITISYCDGNALLGRDEDTWQAYGEVVFEANLRRSLDDIKKHLNSIDFSGIKDTGLIIATLERKLSAITINDKDGKPVIIAKKIPTTPQDRGNCTLKSTKILMRAIIEKLHPEISFNKDQAGYNLYKRSFKNITIRNVNNLLIFLENETNKSLPYYKEILDFVINDIFIQAASKGDIDILNRIHPRFTREINISDLKTEKDEDVFLLAALIKNRDKKIATLRWCLENEAKINSKGRSTVERSLSQDLGLSEAEIKGLNNHAETREVRERIVEKEVRTYGKHFLPTLAIYDVFLNLYIFINESKIGEDAAIKIMNDYLDKKRITVDDAWLSVFFFHKEILEKSNPDLLDVIINCSVLNNFIERLNIDLTKPIGGSKNPGMDLLRTIKGTEDRELESYLSSKGISMAPLAPSRVEYVAAAGAGGPALAPLKPRPPAGAPPRPASAAAPQASTFRPTPPPGRPPARPTPPPGRPPIRPTPPPGRPPARPATYAAPKSSEGGEIALNPIARNVEVKNPFFGR